MSRGINLILLLLVAVCGISVWRGRSADRPGSAVADQAAEASADLQSRPEPIPDWKRPAGAAAAHLVVLNGTAEVGLARAVGLALGALGCVTEQVGNAPHGRFQQTLLVNRRLSGAEAEVLARRLGGVTVIEEADPRVSEDAVLVLGADWPGVCKALGIPLGQDASPPGDP